MLRGTSRNDRLIGTIQNDKLIGGNGNDRLLGDAGDDLLNGGRGKDRLTGGAGGDTFVLSKDNHSVKHLRFADVITDFDVTQGDRLKLVNLERESITLEVVDIDGNGQADATLIRSNQNRSILAVVLGTVNSDGSSLLTPQNFI